MAPRGGCYASAQNFAGTGMVRPADRLGRVTAPGDRRRMRLVRRIAVAVACVATIAGCAFGPPPPDEGGEPPNLPSPSPSNFGGGTDGSATIDVLAKHLKAPWGVAF